MNTFIFLGALLLIWMVWDWIKRKEHFVWLIIMFFLFPVGALAYFFFVKSKAPNPATPAGSPGFFNNPPQTKEIDTQETLQLKDMIGKFNKPYHHQELGLLYFDEKKYELAIPSLKEAITRDPDLIDAQYGLAKSYYALQRYTEAAEILEELVKENKKHDYGNAIFGLAECYRLSGEDDKALEAYEAVINSYHFFKAYYHYARLLDKRGKKQEAIDTMKSLIGSSKDLPDYKLEKERHWIEEAYKFLRKNGIELA